MEQFPNDGEMGSTPAPSASSETLAALSLEIGRPDHGRPRLTGRVGRALPGAIAGVLLVGAIAFGASTVRPDLSDTSSGQATGGAQSAGGGAAGNGSSTASSAGHSDVQNGDETGHGEGTGDGPGAGDGPGTEPTDAPGTEPTEDPGTGVEPTEKADPTEKPEPTKKPGGESMNLVLSVTDGGNVKVDWTRCKVDGAVAYKVVRTADGGIKWPFSGADHQIALIKDLAVTALVDSDAPAGKTLLYRVFCVGGADGAWTFLDSTPGRSVHVPGDEPTPKPEPTPTPQTMSLHLENSESGGIYIGWSTCQADGFSAYKVVRSPDESTKWPLGDNDKLVTYITDRGLTHFVDTDVEAGGHYFYRVFCVKATGDGYKILNSTHVEDFTVPAA